MTDRSMPNEDMVDVQDTVQYINVPSGSRYTTCKSFFNSNHNPHITANANSCLTCCKTKTVSKLDVNCFEYFELVPKLNNHHCFSSNIARITTQNKILWPYFNSSSSLKILLPRLLNLFTGKLFLIICLFFAISVLSVDGAPVTKNNNLKTPSINVESNVTAAESTSWNLDTTPPEIIDSGLRIANTDTDESSRKAKRSTGSRKHKKRGSRRRKGKENKKTSRRRHGKKTKRRNKNLRKSVPIPPDVIHGKSSRNEILTSPRKQRLYNKMGLSFHLAIWKNGAISGEASATRSNYSILEIRGVGEGGKVTIMGALTGRYLCVTKRGAVRARKKYSKSRCQFKEKILPNNQNTYESLSCKGCFLNLNRKGKVRKLKGSNPKLIQAHFLPLKIEDYSPHNHPSYLPAKRESAVSLDFNSFNGTEEETEKLLNSILPEFHDDKPLNDVIDREFDLHDLRGREARRKVTKKFGKSKHSSKSPKHRNRKKKLVKKSHKGKAARGLIGKLSKK